MWIWIQENCYFLRCCLTCIFVGWGDVANTFYHWTIHLMDWQYRKTFWRALCWREVDHWYKIF